MAEPAPTNASRCGIDSPDTANDIRGGIRIRRSTKLASTAAAAPAVKPPIQHASPIAASSTTTPTPSLTGCRAIHPAGTSGIRTAAAAVHDRDLIAAVLRLDGEQPDEAGQGQ